MSPSSVSVRINTLKVDVDDGRRRIAQLGVETEAVPWMPEAVIIPQSDKAILSHSDLSDDGEIYFQDLASMIPPIELQPSDQMRVLDLCAAPGSKTSQLAAMMQNRGHIAAVELSRKRFFRMLDVLSMLGTKNVKTFCRDGRTVWRHRPDHFDRVLLDAPCSSEGRFRRDQPSTFSFWSPAKIKESVRRQKMLFDSAYKSMRPGGYMVYSTCTYAPEENEGVLDWALTKYEPNLTLEPLTLELDSAIDPVQSWSGKEYKHSLTHAKRILPGKAMHGFFVARLRKQ